MVELREFFIEGGDPQKSHVLLHITEPTGSYEEETKGYFFALAEINNGNNEQIQLLQQMIDDIETGYYENKDTSGKDSFELTLEYINRRGHLFLSKKNSNFNCVIGVINNGHITFSYHGKPSIKVIFVKKDKHEMLDVIAEEKENPEQLFSAIMQGEIKNRDFFYIATPHVANHISDIQLLNTLSARTPKQSSEYIQKILSALRDGLSYGGLIMSIEQKDKRIKTLGQELIEETNSVQTNKKINHKPEEKTEPEKAETNYRPRDEKEYDSVFNMILVNLGRSLILLLSTIFNLIKTFFIFLGKGLLGLFILTTNKGGQRAMVIQSFNDFIDSKRQYIKGLPIISKILFLLTIILVAIFTGSLVYLNITKNIRQQKQAYINLISAITDKKTAAEASMIYEDEKKAFDLLKEAEAMIKELPDKNKTQENQKLELMSEITENLKILQKLNTVNTEIVADFVVDEAGAQTKKLARIGDTILAYGPDDLFAYTYDLNTGATGKKEHQTITNLSKASTPKEQDKIVFLTGNNGLAIYSPESEVITSKELPALENSSISDIFVYSQKLYTIDTVNNQVYKHNPTQLGYDKGTPWLKANVDLSDAVSLAIDGDLFLLKSNGQILKFTSGSPQDFSISGLDPELQNATEIWTYNNLDYIYILEPTHKRVVVLNKAGQMIEQYTSDSWQEPTGMVVDEKNKVIYILDNNKIHRFGTQ